MQDVKKNTQTDVFRGILDGCGRKYWAKFVDQWFVFIENIYERFHENMRVISEGL
jgi:hypothetical protein